MPLDHNLVSPTSLECEVELKLEERYVDSGKWECPIDFHYRALQSP